MWVQSGPQTEIFPRSMKIDAGQKIKRRSKITCRNMKKIENLDRKEVRRSKIRQRAKTWSLLKFGPSFCPKLSEEQKKKDLHSNLVLDFAQN